MEQIYLDTPEEQINYEFAGFWIRFVAYLIDAILLGVISGVLWLTLNDYSIVQNVFSFIIGAGYFVYFESGPSQATLGKQLMNIYVVDEQYQRIDSSKAVTRYFSKILSSLILLIGFIMVGFDTKKQGLHDKIAKTYVVMGKPIHQF